MSNASRPAGAVTASAQPWLTQPPRSSTVATRPGTDGAHQKYAVGKGHGGYRTRYPNSVHNFAGTGTICAGSDFDRRNQKNRTGDYRPLIPFAPKADGSLQVG